MTTHRAAALGTLMPRVEGRPDHPAGSVAADWIDLIDAGLAGVCLPGRSVVEAGDITAVTAPLRRARRDLLIAADEASGHITRLAYAVGSTSGRAVPGHADDAAWTEDVARRVGCLARTAGCNLVIGPAVHATEAHATAAHAAVAAVADVKALPADPASRRAYVEEPDQAARHTSAWVRGLQSTGVAGCLRHDPGTATADPAPGPDPERALLSLAAGSRSGLQGVMCPGPSADPNPASASRRTRRGLAVLRDDLGYRGLIVGDVCGDDRGDDAVPEAVVCALAAGFDLVCLGARAGLGTVERVADAIVDAVADGRLDAQRLYDAAARVAALSGATGVDEPGLTPPGDLADLAAPGLTPPGVLAGLAAPGLTQPGDLAGLAAPGLTPPGDLAELAAPGPRLPAAPRPANHLVGSAVGA